VLIDRVCIRTGPGPNERRRPGSRLLQADRRGPQGYGRQGIRTAQDVLRKVRQAQRRQERASQDVSRFGCGSPRTAFW